MVNDKSIKGLSMSQEHLTESIRKKIIIRTVTGVALVAFVTLLVLAIPLYLQLVDANKRDFIFKHKAKAELLDKSVINFKNIAEQIASRTKIREKLIEYNEGKVTLTEMQGFSRGLLADAMQTSKEIVAINRLDIKHNSVLNLGFSVPKSLADSLSMPMKGVKVFDPFSIKNTVVVAVACPILNKNKKEVGVDIVLFDSKSIQKVLRNYDGFGKSGETILGKKAGDRIEGFFINRNGKKSRNLEASEKETVFASELASVSWTALSRIDKAELNELLNTNIVLLVVVVILLVIVGLIGIAKLIDPLLWMLENNLKQLKEKKDSLKKLYTELEVKVIERTRDLDMANKKLKELDQLKSMFIASMSHELRTPLNSIIGFTGVLLQGMSGPLNEQQADQLHRVKMASQHLLSLISDVIDISKIEAGRVEAAVETFSLSKLIHEAKEEIEVVANPKGLSIVIEMGEDLRMQTDKRRLYQCLLNFLSNAVKFTEKSGAIVIRVEEAGENVKISVADNGIGIAQEDQTKLFEAFERVETHMRVKPGGTGLGLYLTRKITEELLEGSIWVESTVGIGSIFGLTIRKIINKKISNVV